MTETAAAREQEQLIRDLHEQGLTLSRDEAAFLLSLVDDLRRERENMQQPDMYWMADNPDTCIEGEGDEYWTDEVDRDEPVEMMAARRLPHRFAVVIDTEETEDRDSETKVVWFDDETAAEAFCKVRRSAAASPNTPKEDRA